MCYQCGGYKPMNTPAALFLEHEDVDAFRKAVIDTNGQFDFGRDDMLELGKVYFDRYPDCFSNRNCTHIQIGYQVTRICMVEIILNSLDSRFRKDYRQLFFNINSIEDTISRLVHEEGFGDVWSHFEKLQKATDDIRHEIDSLPTGMTKERFVGGITNLFNILYLIKSNIRAHES